MAHVLFVDIVAYSTLHMDDQHRVLRHLQDAVRNTAAFIRAQADDQVIPLPTGDGMALVFFHNPEAPVRCALELTKLLHSHPDIKVRMGIHTGPVYRVADVNANRNVAGGGINIAQRVMDCGDAGHILISSTHAEVLGQISSWGPLLHDLGEAEVKHGVRIHLYSLYDEQTGNSELPKKISVQRAAAAVASIPPKNKRSILMVTGATVLAVAAAGGWLVYTRKTQALSATDTIVLADFDNTTGEPVFDGALKQALTASLEQSPFLKVISDNKVSETLKLMGHTGSERLVGDMAREVCVRSESKAVLAGSIVKLGSQYVIGLKAINCKTQESLVTTQVEADSREKVLHELGQVATTMRSKLGESRVSLHNFDTPLEQVTTSSLEALQAYSESVRVAAQRGNLEALPYLKRAVELDPNFAVAHVSLAQTYSENQESTLAAESMKKAFALRDRVSKRERYRITSAYYYLTTGELEKAIQEFELWIHDYPGEADALGNLGYLYAVLAQFDKAIATTQESLGVDQNVGSYLNLTLLNLALNRLEQAKAALGQALQRNSTGPELHQVMYELAFVQKDAEGMQQQIEWLTGKPEYGGETLCYLQWRTNAYHGRVQEFRRFLRRYVESSVRAGNKGSAATVLATAAVFESDFGNESDAATRTASALALAASRDVQLRVALALARIGHVAEAQVLAEKLDKEFPLDTLVQNYWLPSIHAQIELSHGSAQHAIELLQVTSSNDLSGNPSDPMRPVFIRGEAYLLAHLGREAAAEFQKIVDHPGLMLHAPSGALAYLGLARAYALQGDTARARVKYQDFLALWKDADPNIPILKQAKAEYAKLQ